MRLIVVGAGVAGLTVADAARCAGAEVVVLEARDRIGGRTWTVPFGPGAVDLGAAWVHGPFGNPLAEALAGAGIEVRNDGPFWSRMAVWADGWLDAPEATTLAAVAGADFDPEEALAALDGGDSFVDGVEWYLADRGLSGRAAELARFTLLWVVGAMISAGPPERTSLAGLAAYEERGGGNLVVAGGYGTLAERLSVGLDVQLGAPAVRVEHGGPGVAVHAGGELLEGDRAVVTVPLGVLQSGALEFDPPLAGAHADAIGRLEMATLEKVALRFAEPFWPDSVWQLNQVAGDRAFPVWFDFSRHSGSPTLMAFCNPAISPMPAAERIEAAVLALGAMFGSVPDPKEALVTDWSGDPWALGSYSYVPLGSTVEDMRALAEPVSEHLVLAGEATVPGCYGTVQAAFSSGLRAAGQALGAPPQRLSLGPVAPGWLA